MAGEELLRLPVEFRAFRAETERRFAELREEIAAARAEADRRFVALAEVQRRTGEAVATLAEAQRRTEETLQRMGRRREHHAVDFGELKGIMEAQGLRDQAAFRRGRRSSYRPRGMYLYWALLAAP